MKKLTEWVVSGSGLKNFVNGTVNSYEVFPDGSGWGAGFREPAPRPGCLVQFSCPAASPFPSLQAALDWCEKDAKGGTVNKTETDCKQEEKKMGNNVSKFPSTMDAKVWASRCTAWFGSFKVPDLNDWFQAALARGYNEGRRKSDKAIAELRESNLSATRHASEQTALAEIAFADAKRWGELYFAKVVNDGGKIPTSEHAETKDALAKFIRDPAPEAPSPLDPENIMGRAAEGLRDQAPRSPGPEKIEPRWRATKHGAAALDSLLGAIPPEMFEAAEKLGAWAASRGLDDWELGPVRCRFPKLPPSPQPSDPEPKAPGTSAPVPKGPEFPPFVPWPEPGKGSSACPGTGSKSYPQEPLTHAYLVSPARAKEILARLDVIDARTLGLDAPGLRRKVENLEKLVSERSCLVPGLDKRLGDLEAKTTWIPDSRVVQERLEHLETQIDGVRREERQTISDLTRTQEHLHDLEATHQSLISAALKQINDVGDTASKAASRVGQLWEKQAHEIRNANQRIGKLEEKLG